MVTTDEIKLYRLKVFRLLSRLRSAIFYKSGCVSYPTDSSIAYLLGLTPTALSSINRQSASMSGINLRKLLQELFSRLDADSFAICITELIDD